MPKSTPLSNIYT